MDRESDLRLGDAAAPGIREKPVKQDTCNQRADDWDNEAPQLQFGPHRVHPRARFSVRTMKATIVRPTTAPMTNVKIRKS